MQGDFIPLWGIWLGESLESSLPDLLPSASAPLLLWKPPGCSQVTFAALSLGSCISSEVASPVGSSSLSSHGPHTDHTVIAHWSSSGCLSLCFGVWHSATAVPGWVAGGDPATGTTCPKDPFGLFSSPSAYDCLISFAFIFTFVNLTYWNISHSLHPGYTRGKP